MPTIPASPLSSIPRLYEQKSIPRPGHRPLPHGIYSTRRSALCPPIFWFPDPILLALDSVSRPSSFACFQLTVYVPSHHPPYTHTVRTFLHPATRDTYYDSTPREHEPSVLFMCTSIPLSVVLVLHLHTPGQHCALRLSIHVSAFVSVYPFGSRGVYGLRARA